MIVVGYTADEYGQAALTHAMIEASRRGTGLLVVNSTKGDAYADPAFAGAPEVHDVEERLKSSGLAYELTQPIGVDPVDELLTAMDRPDADLLVIGIRHRNPVGKLLLGSVSQQLLLECQKPVLAVKPEPSGLICAVVNCWFGSVGAGYSRGMVDTRAKAANVQDNDWFERVARGGFAASGLLHLLIAFIVARLALGVGGSADKSGALATLAAQPFGAVMLWVAAVVLAALGVWQAVQTFIERDVKDRLKAGAIGIVYFSLAFSAAKFAMGSGESSSRQNAGLSARMMQSGWGKAVLIVVALGLIAVGGYHVYKGVTKGFKDELEISGGTAVTWIGIVGYVAKGLALIGAGLLVVFATFTSDPSKATGVDAAVKTLGAAPFGKFLLLLAAVGIAAYGVYGFIRARYAKM